jgi:hypothetical protein
MSKSINIYWSGDVDYFNETNWSILYNEPESLFNNLLKNINKDHSTRTFFECTAFQSISKNTFVFNNPIHSSYKIINNEVVAQTPSSLFADIPRDMSINNRKTIRYFFPIAFFSEEPIVLTFTPPYMHQTEHFKYGTVIPGRYDISSWIRPIHMEFNLWEDIDSLQILEGEPLFYITFPTEKKINFIKFNNNEKIQRIMNSCSSSPTWEPRVPLAKRYKRFHDSKVRETVLKEIKSNIA